MSQTGRSRSIRSATRRADNCESSSGTTRCRQLDAVQMVVKAEVGVVHPDRVVEIQRAVSELHTKFGQCDNLPG